MVMKESRKGLKISGGFGNVHVMFVDFVCVFFKKEDPRLKIPPQMRRKTSLDPVELGPLPVSIAVLLLFQIIQVHSKYYFL